jgi:hypothetical protein
MTVAAATAGYAFFIPVMFVAAIGFLAVLMLLKKFILLLMVILSLGCGGSARLHQKKQMRWHANERGLLFWWLRCWLLNIMWL